MGADSTLDITREDALKEIARHLETASDEEIANALYELVGHRLMYNFWMVKEYGNRPSEYNKLWFGLS
jgi:hypothetical protein